MKLFKADQIREADAFTIKNEPISSVNLMERAATNISEWIIKHFSKQQSIVILVGSGNNGGDGLVVARHLLEKNYRVLVFDLEISKNYSYDFLYNKKRLEKVSRKGILSFDNIGNLDSYDIIVDAILGSGLTRPIDGELSEKIKRINLSDTQVVAIDIPSGLFGEDNSKNIREHIVKADFTLTFQFPKLSFLLPENSIFIGKMNVFDIGIHPQYISETTSEFFLTEQTDISKVFLKRTKFSHKGTYGHALIFSGSHGKMGAAILASRACLRSGIGLLSTLIPEEENNIMQISLPEAMTFPYTCINDIPDITAFSTVALGPGLGLSKASLTFLTAILEQLENPSIFDADALNLLAANPHLLDLVPKNSIFTPHPKELERLIGKTTDHYSRLFQTQKFAQKYQIYVLIKGAFSCIVCPDGRFLFNSTGNPGMATAGSGDVLTGVVTGLLGQGLSPVNALRTGVFVHGLAGDLAKKEKGELGLIASDIIDKLAKAFLLT